MRQRTKRAIQALADDPRPANSRELDVQGLAQEVRWLRPDKWRMVYASTIVSLPQFEQRYDWDAISRRFTALVEETVARGQTLPPSCD